MIVLYRVDERLIHGQVIVGWGTKLHPDRIVVVDDLLAETQWERELYAVGVPAEMEAEFASVEQGVRSLPRWQASRERVLLLTRDVTTMRRLADSGLMNAAEVNIGGIHHAPGREQVLRYVFLNEAERTELERLARLTKGVVARDVPGARGVDVDELVRSR